jgi:hypothetical protein
MSIDVVEEQGPYHFGGSWVVKGTWTVPGNLGEDGMSDSLCPSITEAPPYWRSLIVLMMVGADVELIWGREKLARECPGSIAYPPGRVVVSVLTDIGSRRV